MFYFWLTYSTTSYSFCTKKNKNAILYMGNNGKRSVQRKYGKNETQKVFQKPVLQEDVK